MEWYLESRYLGKQKDQQELAGGLSRNTGLENWRLDREKCKGKQKKTGLAETREIVGL